MTKERLRNNVLFVMVGLALPLALAIVCKLYFGWVEGYETIKDFSPILIAISAAYLAYCFQQRQAFLVSLRNLWKEMIEAKGALVQYTHNPNPDQRAFGEAHRVLSSAIDSVRGVFRNVEETEAEIGLFPFEPLHDMRRALESLGFVDVSVGKQEIARKQIIRSWNALRWAFLKEFSTPETAHPITSRNASDPRRGSHLNSS